MKGRTSSQNNVWHWGPPIPQKWVCLHCGIVFKLPRATSFGSESEPPKCGRCKNRLWFAGKEFRAPRRNDLKNWRKVALLLQSGFQFYQDAAMIKPPKKPNALLAWHQRNRELIQLQKQASARRSNERNWEQQKRAAAWRAEGKRRRKEAHNEAHRDEN